MATPQVHVGVLGRVRASVGGVDVDLGGARQRALLARLAVDRGATVSTDALIDAVWDGDPPAAAPGTFRTYVARLRRALGSAGTAEAGEVVRTDRIGYRLDDRLTTLDADDFEEAVADARVQLADGEAVAAAGVLEAGLASWEGAAYGPFAERPWAQPEARRLEELRLQARELHVRALLDAERVDEAVRLAEGHAAEHALRESAARLLVLARYRADRHAAALDEVRAFRERLADETGLDPSPQVDELARMVLERDPRLDRPVGGRRLRGYVLHEVVAETVLGTVHRAEQPSIGRDVAVTVVPAVRADDAAVIRAFEARAQAVAAVEHPHVVPVYDYWREPGGAYVVTRFPTGGTLAQWLAARGPLDEDELAGLVEQVGGALVAAHERGVVHGALGPEAVQLDGQGNAFLWAFPVVEGEGHPSSDVVGLAQLVRTCADGGASAQADERGGPRTTTLLRAEVDAVLERVGAADDGIPTVRALVRALGDALGGQRPGQRSAAPMPVGTPGPNPYRGLAAFRETDTEVFFGRAELGTTVRARLVRHGVVAVVGPSGAGKSSVVRAGVLPELRAGGDFVTTMVPGSRPLDELAVALTRIAAVELHDVADQVAATDDGLARLVRHALPGPQGELVLVVDQFEELFTLSREADRDALLRALAHVIADPNGRCRVVLTLRADFLGRALEHPVAGRLVRDRSVMVGPMTSEELHEAVVGPAEVAGVAVEPALATAIVADAMRFPGSLPMVQFALTEVYAANDDGVMTLDAYQRLGGIEGVLGQRAEEVVQGLDATGQEAARVLFSRLVVPNDDGPPTRRRARRSELAVVPDGVVDAFGRARLLLFDHEEETREPTVEVTHEALFRAWPRLQRWIEEGEDDLRLLGHLTVAAADWEARGRQDADLYRGARLDAVVDFGAAHPGELSATEEAFVDAGVRRRAADADDTRRTVRRLRVLTGGLAVGLVAALVAGAVAVDSRGEAVEANDRLEVALEDAETARAAEGEAAAEARAAADRETVLADRAAAAALAASARLRADEDRVQALLLALEAYAIEPDLRSVEALQEVLGADPRVTRVLHGPAPAGPPCLSTPPVGALSVLTSAGSDEPAVAIVRDFGLDVVAEVTIDGDWEWRCPTIDPAGRWLVVGDIADGDSLLRTVDTVTGRVVGQRRGWRSPDRQSADVAVSPRGDEVVMVTSDGRAERLALPGLDPTSALPVDGVVSAAYGEEGRFVSLVTGDRLIAIAGPGADVRTSAAVDEALWWSAVASGAGLAFGASELALYATDLDDPGDLVPVALVGQPVGPPVVSPDGSLLAVPTGRGLEILELPSLTRLGGPVVLDATTGRATWAQGGELHWSGRSGEFTIDLSREAVGRLVSRAVPTGEYLDVAPDGSGGLDFSESGVEWVDLDTGQATPVVELPEPGAGVAELPPGEEWRLHVVLVQEERGWVHVDALRGVVERGVGTEVVARVPLPDEVPDLTATARSAIREDHGLGTIVTLPGTEGFGVVENPWLLVVDVDTGGLVLAHEFGGPSSAAPVLARVLAPDRVLVADRGGGVLVLSMDGEVVVPRRQLGSGMAQAIALSADGSVIAVGGRASGTIDLLDDELEPITTLAGATAPTAQLGFTDGGSLVSRHFDGRTLVWDVESRRLVGPVYVTDGFSQFGFRVSASGDTIIHTTPSGVYEMSVDPDAWFEAACAVVGRPLTQEELDAVTPGRTPLDPCGRGTGG